MAPKIPTVIQCNTEDDVRRYLADYQPDLVRPETEESWDAISNAFLRLTAICNGGACDFPQILVPFLRNHSRSVASAVATERSRLSASATEFVTTLASGLGTDFEPLVSLYIPTILSICARPNKVFVSRGKATIRAVIEQTQLPAILPYLVSGLKDKSPTMRLIAIEGVLICLNCLNPPDLERESRAKEIESAIKSTATDASGDVRRVSRQVFESYSILLPSRVDSFTAPMSPTMKKYLNLNYSAPPSRSNSRPPSQQSTRPTSRPASAMSTQRTAEIAPRPATSMAHSRSASGNNLAGAASLSTSSSSTYTMKLSSRNENGAKIAPGPRSRSRAGSPPLRRRDEMPPPAIVPQRPPQIYQVAPTSETAHVRAGSTVQRAPSQAGSQRTVEARVGKGLERPSSTATTIAQPIRPAHTASRVELPQQTSRSNQPVRPSPSQPLTTKEKLMGVVGARRIPHHEAQTSELEMKQAVPVAHLTRQRANSKAAAFKPTSSGAGKQPAAEVTRTKSTAGAADATTMLTSTSNSKAALVASSKPAVPTQSTAGSVSSKLPDKALKTQSKPGTAGPLAKQSAPSKGVSASSQTSGGALVKLAMTETRRRGDLTQPTLSQLARMKAGEDAKQKRSDAPPISRPLSIRNKARQPSASSAKILVKKQAHEEVVKAAAVPLPPSPKAKPAEVPLPLSRPPTPPITANAEDSLNEMSETMQDDAAGVIELTPFATATPHRLNNGIVDNGKTPISSLVDAIQRGFMYTPHSPLSPPSAYAGAGEPWTGWPAGMGAFAQKLPPTKSDSEIKDLQSPSPRTDAKWLDGLMPEEDSFFRPVLADMDMN